MANQPIPVEQANEMIQFYMGYMKGLGVDMNKQTQSVSFTAPELLKWMADVQPYSDEFRICEAVYGPTHENAGRITTIIWPYKNGQPAALPAEGKDGNGGPIRPYNEGTTNP